MRIISLLLLLVLYQGAHAQDFCNLLKKEVSPDHTIYDYSSPFDPNEPPAVRVSSSYGTNPDYATDNFFVIFQMTNPLESIYKKTDTGEIEKEEVKLVVEFEDKSKYIDDTIKITHDFTNDRMNAIRTVFYSLNEKSIKEFAAKKITKFSLAGYEQAVPADSANAIQHYVQCLKDVKKD